jgi:ParB-like chromosome segregation protein Spo0J
LSPTEYERLKADIGENSLLDPITTYQGQIVDGRNRYRACRELGIEPRTVEWSGTGSLLDFVVSRNDRRRHLTDSQRALVAARVANLKEGRPAKTAQIEAVSQAKAAQRFVVSRTSV